MAWPRKPQHPTRSMLDEASNGTRERKVGWTEDVDFQGCCLGLGRCCQPQHPAAAPGALNVGRGQQQLQEAQGALDDLRTC
jgi:hypothetical protein